MAAYRYVFIRPTQIEGIHYAIGSPADGFSDGTMESLIRACRITVGEGGGEKVKKPRRRKPAAPKVESAEEEVSAETEEEVDAEAESREDAEGDDEADDSLEGDDESDEEADDDALTLKQLGVGKKFLEGFASAKLTTLGEARKYLAEHGSFEKLPNIGDVTSRDLVAQLGL